MLMNLSRPLASRDRAAIVGTKGTYHFRDRPTWPTRTMGWKGVKKIYKGRGRAILSANEGGVHACLAFRQHGEAKRSRSIANCVLVNLINKPLHDDRRLLSILSGMINAAVDLRLCNAERSNGSHLRSCGMGNNRSRLIVHLSEVFIFFVSISSSCRKLSMEFI